MKLLSIMASFLLMLSCQSTPNVVVQAGPSQPLMANSTVISNPDPAPAVAQQQAPGFDLNAFASLMKTTSSPQLLEQAINAPGNAINNVDADGDGNVDFLSVQEAAGNIIQVVDNSASTPLVIATATLTNVGNQVNFAYSGVNTMYCGSNYTPYYHYSVGDLLFWHYMMRPHPYWYPHYSRGYYPRYYTPHRAYYRSGGGMSSSYRSSRTTTVTKSTTTVHAPAVAKAAPIAPRNLSNNTNSVRSFTTRNPSTPVRTSGFGGGSSSSSHSSPASSPSRSFSSSRSSFGGGRRR